MLRSRLLRQFASFYLVLVIIPSSFLFMYSYKSMRDNAQNEMQTSLRFEMEKKNMEIDTVLSAGQSLLHAVFSSPEISSVLAKMYVEMQASNVPFAHYYGRYELHPLLEKLVESNDIIENALIFMEDQCVYAYRGHIPENQSLCEDEEYQKIRAFEGNVCLLGETCDPFSIAEGSYLLYGCKINNPYSTHAESAWGTIVLLIAQERVEQALATYERYDDNVIALYDGGGELLSTNAQDEKTRALLLDAWKEGMEEAEGESLFRPKKRPDLYAFVKRSDLMNTSFVQLTAAYHFDHVLTSVTQVSVLSMAASTLLLLLFLVLVSRTILNPVLHLSKAMEQVGQNDMSVRVTYPYKNELSIVFNGFNSMIENILEYIRRVQEEEKEKRRYQIAMLKYQINPHFLYNTLNCIRFSALRHEDEDTAQMLVTLSRLLRHTLTAPSMLIPLHQEMNNLRDFIALEQIRYKQQIDVDIECGEQNGGLKVPAMLLQPIVENAIAHGLSKALNEGGEAMLRIAAQVKEGKLVLSVWDNGMGISPEQAAQILSEKDPHTDTNGNHIGLRNIQERIRLLFGAQYGLRIESEPDAFTCILILLPMVEASGEEV